jgi:TetR/AcrR family transcriptional regulator, ethionamide resistance regulator
MAPTRRAAAPRQRRTTSEQQILDATMALLRSGQRLPDIAVNDILDAAGVSRSTFYQYFSSKTELAFRVAEPAMDAARTASDGWWKGSAWGNSSDLGDVVRTLMAQGREHRLEWLALFDIADRDPDAAVQIENLVQNYVAQMSERLTSEQAAGRVSRAIEPPQLGRIVLVTTRACILDQLAHGNPDGDARFAAELGRMLWLAINQH